MTDALLWLGGVLGGLAAASMLAGGVLWVVLALSDAWGNARRFRAARRRELAELNAAARRLVPPAEYRASADPENATGDRG